MFLYKKDTFQAFKVVRVTTVEDGKIYYCNPLKWCVQSRALSDNMVMVKETEVCIISDSLEDLAELKIM